MNIGIDLNLNMIEKKEWPSPDPDKVYDMIIVGGGSAGLNTALYAKRKGLEPAILADRPGGQVLDTTNIENYLGCRNITGEQLISRFEEHVRDYDVPMLEGVRVNSINDGPIKELICDNGYSYKAYTVVIATGSRPRRLDVPGEKEYFTKGVTYCAICDGPLYKNQDVIVAGGGDSAVEAAIDLARIAKSVKVVQRSVFRANRISVDKLLSLDNVEIYLNTQIRNINGDGQKLTSVTAYDKSKGAEFDLGADGLFVEIGSIPMSDFVKDLVELNDIGEIVVNKKAETNIPGIYAAGDVTNSSYKQIIIAAAEGAKAALSASDYLNRLKVKVLGGENGIFK